GAVDEAAGQDGFAGGAAFPAEEGAGDLPGGVLALFDVHRQREKVEVVLGVLAGGGGGQDHRVLVQVGDGGAGGLLGQASGLETYGAGAERAVVDHGLGGCDFGPLHGCPPSCVRRGSTVIDRGSRTAGVRKPLPRTSEHRGVWMLCYVDVMRYAVVAASRSAGSCWKGPDPQVGAGQ